MKAFKKLLILLFSLIVVHSYSQGVEIEYLLRPTQTSLRGNLFFKEYLNPRVNFSAGLGVNLFIKSSTLINGAVLYEKKGGAGEHKIQLSDDQGQPTGEGTVTNSVEFDYITIPIQWENDLERKLNISSE
ncbi:MAG: hypothetical protein KIT62_02905 [Cyclobacteriaceae bacterium]|nr:hypothetical protein [Cyclobacteriaceae bacterium]